MMDEAKKYRAELIEKIGSKKISRRSKVSVRAG
jgi:hypothetical protein